MAVGGRPFRMDSGSPGATSEVSAVAIGQRSSPRSTSGSFRALETTKECTRRATSSPKTPGQSRCRTRDGSLEGVQTRKSVGGDGGSPRASRGRFEGRFGKGQGSFEETICEGRNRRVSQVHLEGGEAHHRAGHGAGEGKSFSRDWWTSNPETPDTLPGSQVTALQQMVNLLQSERDALAKELTAARSTISEDQTSHPAVKKQAVSRQASSRRDAHGRIPLMPCRVPNDITNWLEDRQADFQEALAQGDLRSLPELSRMLSEGARHLTELCSPQPSSGANMVT